MDIKNANIKSGLNIYKKGCPSALSAVSSDLSAIPPTNIIEARRTDNGSAIGINVNDEYHNSSKTTFVSRPLPIKSSMYFQRNCINKTSITVKNVINRGFRNDEKINFLNMFKMNTIKNYEPKFFIKVLI